MLRSADRVTIRDAITKANKKILASAIRDAAYDGTTNERSFWKSHTRLGENNKKDRKKDAD